MDDVLLVYILSRRFLKAADVQERPADSGAVS
jgi:hypothetical protein